MNFTLDQYLAGLESLADRMVPLLAEWDNLDPELQEEYTSQLNWMLSVRSNVVMEKAAIEGRSEEAKQRIEKASAKITDLFGNNELLEHILDEDIEL